MLAECQEVKHGPRGILSLAVNVSNRSTTVKRDRDTLRCVPRFAGHQIFGPDRVKVLDYIARGYFQPRFNEKTGP